jgi:hypothetical protein
MGMILDFCQPFLHEPSEFAARLGTIWRGAGLWGSCAPALTWKRLARADYRSLILSLPWLILNLPGSSFHGRCSDFGMAVPQGLVELGVADGNQGSAAMFPQLTPDVVIRLLCARCAMRSVSLVRLS